MKLKADFKITELMGVRYGVAVVGSRSEYGCMVRLENDTTARIFSLIRDGLDEESIIAVMLDEYDVEETVLRKETDTFLKQLEDGGLLER